MDEQFLLFIWNWKFIKFFTKSVTFNVISQIIILKYELMLANLLFEFISQIIKLNVEQWILWNPSLVRCLTFMLNFKW